MDWLPTTKCQQQLEGTKPSVLFMGLKLSVPFILRFLGEVGMVGELVGGGEQINKMDNN